MARVAYSWDEDSAETHEMAGKPRPSRGAWTNSSSEKQPEDSGEHEVDDQAPTRAVRPVTQEDIDERAPTRAVKTVSRQDVEDDGEDEPTVVREQEAPGADHTGIIELYPNGGAVAPLRSTLPWGASQNDLGPPPPRPMVARGVRIDGAPFGGPAAPGGYPPSLDATPGPTALPPPPSASGLLPFSFRWPLVGAAMGALSLFLTVLVAIVLLLPQHGDLRIELTAHGGGQVSRAEIFVDGQKRCDSAPCIVADLPAGPRMIKVIAPGQAEATTTTEVVEVGRERIALVTLRAPSATAATLHAQASQPGVRIQIDGVDRGELPVRVADLAPGEHRLKFEGERYETIERTVDLSAGQTKDLGGILLKVRRGRVTVDLATPGATVLLTRAGADAHTGKVLPGPWPMAVEVDGTSDWRLTASHRGHGDTTTDVSFADGQPEKRVRIELSRGDVSALPEAAPAAAAPAPAAPARPAAAAVRSAPRPDPAPAPAAPAGGSGSINANSLPASKVLIDGRALGETPQVDIKASAGNHTVTFIHPEHGRKSVTVTVKPGQTATAAVRFKK